MQGGEIKRGLDATKLRQAIFEALGVSKKPKEQQKVAEPNAETEEIASI